MAAVEEALPALHHEKVVYLDALAQARVVAGNIKVFMYKASAAKNTLCINKSAVHCIVDKSCVCTLEARKMM